MKKLKKYFIFFFAVFIFFVVGIKTSFAIQAWQNVGEPGFSAGGAYYTSIAIDATGTPYVVYRDGGISNKAVVKKFDGSSWVTVGTAGFSAGQADYTSIVIDATGTPYVVYQDYGNSSKAVVKKFDGSSWVTVGTAGSTFRKAYYTSLAIDATGTPYIVYKDVLQEEIVGRDGVIVKKFNGSSWVTVGTYLAEKSDYTSISIDATGTPYVVYSDSGNSNKTTVKKFNGSSWVTVGTAGFSAGATAYTSIAIDATGIPYVVYRDGGISNKAVVKKFDGSSWVTVGEPGFSVGIASYTSIAIDATGIPYVVYQDGGKAVVKKFDGSSWVTVNKAGFSEGEAYYTSIAIDATGTPYVVYRDYGNSYKVTVMKSVEIIPILIDSIQDLYNIRNYPDEYYILDANLDFNDFSSYDSTTSTTGYETVEDFQVAMTNETGWFSIGTNAAKFTGTFDGNGYTISNLFINRPETDYIGLFGVTNSDAILINIVLEDVNVTGHNFVGGLVGYNDGSTILNSYSTGSVSGGDSSWSVGGLVGYNDGGTILNSYSTGSVSGGNGSYQVGGLVGGNFGTILNSYSTGSVSGTYHIGGLVGRNSDTISNSYATGFVTGSSDIGGLVGINYDTVESSYYNSETSGQSDYDGRGEPRTTLEMTDIDIFVDWDFTDTWSIDEGVSYPYLQIQDSIYIYNYLNTIPRLTKTISSIDTNYYVTLDWSAVTVPSGYTLVGYDIYENDIKIETATTSIQYVGSIESGYSYEYYITAVFEKDEVQLQTKSNIISFTFNGISSIQELYKIRNNLDYDYDLVANLDFNDIDSYDETLIDGYDTVLDFKSAMTTGTGWLPIGDYDNKFMGNFDGNGYIISNLYINTDLDEYIGFFGCAGEMSNLTNIGLENINITSTYDDYAWGIGGLAGANYLGTITNSYTTGV
ncbi:MAG: GLUG motif-containing protein, partial [Patescibacteria group bacterium]|nr:GLUG motif-containing protein [Patescibacteria group bacterium]MDD4304858.1 GLUG motif-containing protein [Patescibacteria group bacterium]MDD4695842.1 GLUG motif-containing protein [Patescibacteria group bacterium]